MSMKILVATVMVIFSVFMSVVFVAGFLDKQQKEAAVTNQANSSQTQSNNTNQSSSSDNSGSSPSQGSKTFTTAEVATHNKPQDCYLIIHNNVYNVTNFLDQHPGGTDVILPYCGKDATQAFETQGGRRGTHSQSARSLLAQYQIGTLTQ